MKTIIDPIPRDILEKELTEELFVRTTNNSNNSIYIFNAHNAPNMMLELGRVRELTFRNAGGGTGKEVDIDSIHILRPPTTRSMMLLPLKADTRIPERRF